MLLYASLGLCGWVQICDGFDWDLTVEFNIPGPCDKEYGVTFHNPGHQWLSYALPKRL